MFRIRSTGHLMIACALVTLSAPASAQRVEGPDSEFAQAIAEAHGAEAWFQQAALRADMSVHFGGGHLFDATYTFRPTVGPVHMAVEDGPTVVFDGTTAWLSPSDSDFKQPRFHLKTWPYFLAAPMKLADPGVYVEPTGEREYDGQRYETAKVTFGKDVGDSPKDWYVAYRHPETHELKAMAYIVTYDKSVEKAEQQPHAIVFRDYREFESSTVSMDWRFYKWSEEKGIYGDEIGHVTVSNLESVSPSADLFTKPDNAREVTLPE